MEIEVKGVNAILPPFVNLLGMEIDKTGTIRIPEQYGKGYVRVFTFEPGIRMLIRNYELHEELKIQRTDNKDSNERAIISFQNIFSSNISEPSTNKSLPSVQVYSDNIDYEIIYPGKTKYQSINIGIEIEYLRKLLDTHYENHILKFITEKQRFFLFEELISPPIQKVTNEIVGAEIPEDLQNFYFKVKAEELICLLFVELLKRKNTNISAINTNDIQTIYSIRDKIIFDLSTPPVLADLATQACMSESKLKNLFKQVFGNSIYNYFQNLRMQEAARLLGEGKLTVSDVGYQLGFSNLSHFSRLFEEHIGVKPKKYAMM
jgi:AraC-like DNA-binding protein